jgi:ABC-type uncharacterized transport system involved in gliding motility auxiliary subunit
MRRSAALLALALAVVIFAGVNIFAGAMITNARLDLTENGTFTISPGTRAIIAKLPEPVTLKFYYSKKAAAEYAATVAYAKRVRDLLGQYAALSHGKIVVQDIDPEAFTPEEDEAGAAGLVPAPTEKGEVVYFGLAGSNRIDGKETIPYFAADREPYLEYDLSSLLYRLSNPVKPVVGLITSLPLEAQAPGQQPPAIFSALRQSFQVSEIPASFTQLPAKLDLLLIAHPPALSAPQLAAIDVFVKRGGRALVFVDPLSEMAEAAGGTPTSDLGALLQGWGIAYAPDRVVLDRQLAQRVATGNDPRAASMAYPLWLHLTAENFDPRDPITANLQNLNLASAGALTPAHGFEGKFKALLTSSDQASLAPVAAVAGGADPARLVAMVHPTGQHFTLAARVGRVVVVADSDFLDDRFWVRLSNQLGQTTAQPFADNGGLLLNAVDNLTGSGDLIALRTRTNTDRPFTVVRAMQADAEAKFQETAEALQARLTAAQQEVQQLQQGGKEGATSLTPKQQADITRLKQEMAQTRSQLRDVQHNLRADIDALGAKLAFINIVLMPLLVAAFAIVLGIIRRGRARPRGTA